MQLENRSGIIGQAEIAERLTKLEQVPAVGLSIDVASLEALSKSALFWSERGGSHVLLGRLARVVLKTGDAARAAELLRAAQTIAPTDQGIAVMLCESLQSASLYWEALQAIAPAASAPNAKPLTLATAAKLHQKAGDIERSIQLYERAACNASGYRVQFLQALLKTDRKADAIAHAERILGTRPQEPGECLTVFTVLLRLDADAQTVERARSLLLERAAALANGAIWRARLLRLEGKTNEALAEFVDIPPPASDDPQIVVERAGLALAAGYWGRDARYLLQARTPGSPASLLDGIEHADALLRSCGTSLEEAAKAPPGSLHIRSPETAFETILGQLPARPEQRDTGMVMIVTSLACGGAERIVANGIRGFARDPRFAWTKLYACSVSRSSSSDFYLPNTGLGRSEIILLEGVERLELPWAWLGAHWGRLAQNIYSRLQIDRPGIVHTTLDYVNLVGGLAALAAGVPRVVMHVHNMRPSELDAPNPDRMRDCYRAILKRPEVSLVTCAESCTKDYADWLQVEARDRFYTVYNGMDVEHIASVASPSVRTARREALGLSPETPLVGTAFRFVDLKQPFLWVDAAQKVLSFEPRCMFVMMGDGELHEDVCQYVRARALDAHFLLPGRVQDIYKRLSALDLFVLSSRTEALPNTLIEAQAAGVPVIAFDVGGIAETMIEGVTGWLVREHTADALADKIISTLADTAWRGAASMAGRSFARDKFGNGRMIKSLSAVLLSDGVSALAPAV